jgi:hypothetical protein
MSKRTWSLAVGLACVALAASAATLPYRVVVDREGPEEAALEGVRAALVTEAKLDQVFAQQALRGLDGYIDKRVERQRKTVTLYPQSIFAIAKAAGEAKWKAADAGALLARVQQEIDDEGRSATATKRICVQAIGKGLALDAVIAAMEAEEGAPADKDDD